MKPTKNSDKTKNSVEETQAKDIVDKQKLFTLLKKITTSTWGMRISLVVIAILIFFIAYFFGSLGKDDLYSKIDDKKEEILICKKKFKKEKEKVKQQQRRINILQNKLSDSRSRMQFLKQREKIRKPLHKAYKSWKKGNRTETVENLYSVIINLKSEATNSIGISRYFYNVIIGKLNLAIKVINNVCKDEKTGDNGPNVNIFKSVKDAGKPRPNGFNAANCNDKINLIILEALDILPPPDA